MQVRKGSEGPLRRGTGQAMGVEAQHVVARRALSQSVIDVNEALCFALRAATWLAACSAGRSASDRRNSRFVWFVSASICSVGFLEIRRTPLGLQRGAHGVQQLGGGIHALQHPLPVGLHQTAPKLGGELVGVPAYELRTQPPLLLLRRRGACASGRRVRSLTGHQNNPPTCWCRQWVDSAGPVLTALFQL